MRESGFIPEVPFLLPRAWASLKRGSLLSPPCQGAQGSSPFFPRQAPALGEWKPEACPGENVGRPEKQVILPIPFLEEGVESLVRLGRKAMEKRKELFQTYLSLISRCPLLKNNHNNGLVPSSLSKIPTTHSLCKGQFSG